MVLWSATTFNRAVKYPAKLGQRLGFPWPGGIGQHRVGETGMRTVRLARDLRISLKEQSPFQR